MQQQLSVNLTIPVPNDSIIISKIELEELENAKLIGVYWSMKDIEKRVNKKQQWIKQNILYPSKFRKILDINDGGFVYYPKSQGETWSFKASEMARFLENHFNDIFSE